MSLARNPDLSILMPTLPVNNSVLHSLTLAPTEPSFMFIDLVVIKTEVGWMNWLKR